MPKLNSSASYSDMKQYIKDNKLNTGPAKDRILMGHKVELMRSKLKSAGHFKGVSINTGANVIKTMTPKKSVSNKKTSPPLEKIPLPVKQKTPVKATPIKKVVKKVQDDKDNKYIQQVDVYGIKGKKTTKKQGQDVINIYGGENKFLSMKQVMKSVGSLENINNILNVTFYPPNRTGDWHTFNWMTNNKKQLYQYGGRWSIWDYYFEDENLVVKGDWESVKNRIRKLKKHEGWGLRDPDHESIIAALLKQLRKEAQKFNESEREKNKLRAQERKKMK